MEYLKTLNPPKLSDFKVLPSLMFLAGALILSGCTPTNKTPFLNAIEGLNGDSGTSVADIPQGSIEALGASTPQESIGAPDSIFLEPQTESLPKPIIDTGQGDDDTLKLFLKYNPIFAKYMNDPYFRKGLFKMFEIESGKSYGEIDLTEVSYHGQEQFLTTQAGITQIAYDDYRLRKGLETTDLVNITEYEIFDIIFTSFLLKSKLYELVHPALLIQQLQVEFNSPVLGDEIAIKFLYYLEEYSIDPKDPRNLKVLSEVLFNLQVEVYKGNVDPGILDGLKVRFGEFRV